MKIIEPFISKTLIEKDVKTINNDTESIKGSYIRNGSINVSVRNLSVVGSTISKIDFTHSHLEGFSLDNVLIDDCILTAGKFSESSWRRVRLTASRCSGIQLDQSTLKDTTFRGCKLDITNFRYAKLTNILFENCIVDEMDFYEAELKNVCFINCDINGLELQNTKLEKVDFRESNLVHIKRSGDLKGALINSEQLIFLSPQLAAQAGIIVED